MNSLNKRSRVARSNSVRTPKRAASHLIGLALSLLGLTNWLILPGYAWSRPAPTSALATLEAPAMGALSTIGLFRPSSNLFFLRNSNASGAPDITVGFGAPGDFPIVGDWDGNGTVTIGLYRPSSSTFFLRNTNTLGPPEIALSFGDGPGGDVPVAGDWDGNGTWTIGVYRPGSSTFYLRNSNTWGTPDIIVPFGAPGDQPLAGDWDGNGTMTIGLFRPSGNLFFLRNTNNAGAPDITVPFGAPDDQPIVGDWDGNGTTTIGLFRPAGNFFFLRNSNTLEPPDITVGGFGAPGDKPIVGSWATQSSDFDFALEPNKFSVAISCGPDNPVDYGCGAEIGITALHFSGNPQPVFLSVQGLPEYAYFSFSPNPVTTGSSTSLVIGMYPRGPATYRITVVGTSGTLTRLAFFDLIE